MRISTLGLAPTEQLVTPLHEEWLRESSNGAVYSEWALIFAEEQLRSRDRVRVGSYSASSLGSCARQQQLTFLGMPRTPLRPRQIQVSHNGTWMHLRWQMAGLTAGWLHQAEVTMPVNPHGLRGTLDGVLTTGQGLELKSCNRNAFSGVMTFGIKAEHDFQVHSYMLGTGIDTFSVIYENKDTQEWVEIVRHRDQRVIEQVLETREHLAQLESKQELAEMIPECVQKKGWRYEWCEFRKICPKASWSEEPGPEATSS